MYLRKSRADKDFIDEPLENTLKRHKARLDQYCEMNDIFIEEVLQEVVSGDSIASRPQMMKLLSMVETGNYDGVVVIELDRLCRGDSADQGIVSNTFKYSNTKIITPIKTYDFTNEFDEEYAEFGLMMGRKEYRTIKRRMLNGRIDAVNEGKYVGGNPPYGYETYKLKKQKGYSLRIIPDQAEIVKLIFEMYTNGIIEDGQKREVGSYVIARKLNSYGYLNQYNAPWNEGHVTKILSDETYTGKIVFMRRKTRKIIVNGSFKSVEENNSSDKMVRQGLHEPIISEEVFEAAKIIKRRKIIPHLRQDAKLANPFCRIMYCSICGSTLRLRSADTTGNRALFCPNVSCSCKGTYLDLVEKRFITALNQWADGYMIKTIPKETDYTLFINNLKISITNTKKEISKLEKQLENTFSYFEQQIYTRETFIERSELLRNKIKELKNDLHRFNAELNKLYETENARNQLIPNIQNLINVYESLDAQAKNQLIKQVIEKIEYSKLEGGKLHRDAFNIKIYPRIPKL